MPAFNPGTSFSLTSRFSSARSLMGVTRPHKGVDFRAISGTAIPAAGNGKVVLKKFNRGGYGHYVILEHRNKDGEFI
ncbi:MAG: M23 family metallopeptidase, partial [Shewanella sp.]